jgi:hypothetical protein
MCCGLFSVICNYVSSIKFETYTKHIFSQHIQLLLFISASGNTTF